MNIQLDNKYAGLSFTDIARYSAVGQVVDADTQKAMLAWYYKKQEEQKVRRPGPICAFSAVRFALCRSSAAHVAHVSRVQYMHTSTDTSQPVYSVVLYKPHRCSDWCDALWTGACMCVSECHVRS